MSVAVKHKRTVSMAARTSTAARTSMVEEEIHKSTTQQYFSLSAPVDRLAVWLRDRAFRKKDVAKSKVSIISLLSYSTTRERWLMLLGIISAGISGLGIPAWLVMLALSLDKFNDLAKLINAIGNEGLQDALQTELNRLVGGFIIIGAVALVAGSLYCAIWTYTGEKQALRIKNKFVQSALQQDAAWFDSHNREELPTNIATSMVHISNAIGRELAGVFCNAMAAAGCLAVALILNAPLALIMLAVVPVVGICIAILSCFIRRKSQASADEFNKAGAIATEVISGIKTVASLCAQPWALASYQTMTLASQRYAVYSGILASLVAGITGFLFYCTYSFAFAIGTEQVARDATMAVFLKCLFDDDPNCSVTGASIMCCIYGVILCATFFGLMAPGIQAINLGLQAAVDVFDTIERTPEIDSSSPDGLTLDTYQGGLELRDVLFSYPSRPRNPIFVNFNLKIEPGQSVALVGPSGSGKSTIAKLLLRFYDPNAGQVLVDGVAPLSDLNVSWWRNQVGYVAQEPTLFPGTLFHNIAVGKPGGTATEEEVVAAAQAACAHDFIKALPDGYDTFYSGASIQLSGGQMQRIAIARAIIREPTVLLLDEATSALDSNSEQQVQQALANVRKTRKMTTVTVAHRLSTIISSDQIAVISDGAVAEMGTHRSLFEKNGIYTTLCESQGITADSQGAEEMMSESALSIEQSLIKPESTLAQEPDEENLLEQALSRSKIQGEEEELQEEELAPMSRLWKYAKTEFLYIFIGVLGAAVVGALSPSEAILTAQIVSNYYTVKPEEMEEANRKWTLGFLAFAGAALVGNFMIGYGLSNSGYRLARRMRVLAFEAIVRRGMGWFDFPEHSTGELTTRLAVDSEIVGDVSGWQLGYRVRMFTSLITGVIISLIYSWQVGLTAIACIPLIMGAAVVQAMCLAKRYVSGEEMSPATILEQGLRGISAIQAYNLEKSVGEDYSNALKPESAGKVKQGTIAGLVYGLSQCAVFVSFAVVFYVGSALLVNGEVNFADFFTAILSVMFGALGMAQVNANFKARQDAQAAAARIFAILDAPLDDTDPFSEKGEAPGSLNGTIAFKSCYFHYPTRPNNPIFYEEGLSVNIAAKESVAFVGKSGCGKSSALQLVLRFYEVSDGGVFVDEHNVEDLNVTWLRDQIGYVGQQPVLFSGTVRENVLLGKPDATEDEIVEAAKAANAHDFVVKLSNGYDTDIGAGGSLLSGGQKQRIAIARAIVKNPQMLVLDEATSALDNESERVVQAALDELQQKQPRTTLVVAHRLMTVKQCDKIVVLDKGKVKELGSHDSLLSQKGLYHELRTR